MSSIQPKLDGIEIAGPLSDNFTQILTPEALRLVAKLHRAFNGRRKELLERRNRRQAELDSGRIPDFLP
jgi:malate synthase